MDEVAARFDGLTPDERDSVLAELAARLDPRDAGLLTVARRSGSGQPAALSYQQEQLWFLDRLTPEQSPYHAPVAARLRGELDLDALRWALGEVLRRHESLRSSVAVRDGMPVARVAAARDPVLEPEPLPPGPGTDAAGTDAAGTDAAGTDAGTDAVGTDAAVVRAVADVAREPFDLECGPLLRARLFRAGPADHVLAVTVHHLAGDNTSAALLLDELGRLYSEFRAGRPAPLPEPPIRFADVAHWQRTRLENGDLDEELEYWEQRLSGLSTLELPADRARPALPSFTSERVTGSVGAEVADRLRAMAGERDATLFTTLVATLAMVLSRYTGQDDIVVGSTVAGRDLPELRDLVGPFTNMVVLRTDLSGDPTFAELLDRVARVVSGALAHREVPFGKVVERLRPERDPSRNPLFQVGIQLAGEPAEAPVLTGLDVSFVDAPLGRHALDLSLTAVARADGLRLEVEYATDLFDPARIRRMVDHVTRVLAAVAADPELRLSTVPLLSDAERADVLEHWQGGPQDFAREPIHVLVAEQAAARPDAVAAVFEGRSLSYGELDHRAGLLARYLRSIGVRHQDIVGVALERGLDAVVALLGVLKAGAAFTTLEPTHPPARLGFMLDDAGAPVVITHSTLAGRLPAAQGRTIVCLDEVWPAAQALAGEPLPEWATGDSAAYVLYTSGSTGTPKGVVVEHTPMVVYTSWLSSVFGIGPGDRMLQFASLVFDLAEGEICTALVRGATLVLVPRETTVSPDALAELIRGERVDYLGAPPAMLAMLEAEPYPDLRAVLVGGEAFTGELVNRWNLPGRTFLNAYGPTEATVGCTFYICERTTWSGSPPIGRAMPNRRVYLLDRWNNPVPVGVPGEIVAAGEGLARGYHGRPELTAERFVADPFRPGERAYRTGDLGMWTPDGQIQFLGRIDTQVKLRGQRIELEEIEAVLADHPALAQATVVLRQDRGADRRLVAYTVPVPGGPALDGRALRAHLAEHLPEYMIPAAFVSLDAMPLTATGKVDRAALPVPDISGTAGSGRAPGTATEQAVADIFAEILATRDVGALDNFFELGGNSLQATLVLGRIREQWDVSLPMREFYADPAVEPVARAIEGSVLDDAAAAELASLLDELEETGGNG